MSDYISKYGRVSENEALTIAKKYFSEDCTVYAVHSDSFYCGTELDIDFSHLTELRIFNKDSEFKLIRYNIGGDFKWRYISDTKFMKKLADVNDEFLSDFNNRIFNEIQYLDIDSKKSNGKNYVTTGGGKYSLLIENAERIEIRSYLDYDEHGILSINDFRIVRILKKGE